MDNETNPGGPDKRSSRMVIPIVIAAVIVLAVIALAMRARNSNTSEQTTTPPTTQTAPRDDAANNQNSATPTTPSTDSDGTSPTTPSTSSTSEYKDGTYSSDGSYSTPAGTEKLGVEVTLKDGVVTAANVTSKGVDPNTKNFQGKFISGYKTLVVGKKIDEIKLDKVSGSSLSPGGFNNAVDAIKTQAKA